MRINFDFTDLEVFLAVKDSGSFHLAGERLGLSQSSVTRRIQKLETALGSALFERTTRDVRPTLAAKRLRVRAEAMLNEAQETARAMRDESMAYAHQRAQTVTVATIPTVVSSLVVPAIQGFRDSGRQERIRLLDLAANEVAEAVADCEADFGICSVPMLEPTTEFEPLFTDPVVLAMPSAHPLAATEHQHWANLQDEVLILPARGTGNRLMIDEALARARLQARWTYEVGRTSTALDLVEGGVGIAPMPRSVVTSTRGKDILYRSLSAPEVSRPIGILTRLGQIDTAPVTTLKGTFRTAARLLV